MVRWRRWCAHDDDEMTDKDGGGTRVCGAQDGGGGGYVEQVFESCSRRVREDSTSTTYSEQQVEEEFEQWLWEAYQQHQESEGEVEYEAAGEVSDCMYHHAKGGLHGQGRVRMFLPALNKGNTPLIQGI